MTERRDGRSSASGTRAAGRRGAALAATALLWGTAGCGGAAGISPIVDAWYADNPRNQLAAFVEVETDADAAVLVEFASASTAAVRTPATPTGTSHRVPIRGMRADTRYELTPIAIVDGMEHAGEPLAYRSGEPPGPLPLLEVTSHDPDQVTPGPTLFGPSTMDEVPLDELGPAYIGIDGDGEVVWYHEDPPAQEKVVGRDASLLPAGTLLLLGENRLIEITLDGETLLEVTAEQAGVERFHHEGIQLSDGALATLAHELRDVDVPELGGHVPVLGDEILVLERDGAVRWRWSAFDHLDTQRFPTEMSRRAEDDGVYDWTHANSLVHLPDEDAMLLCARHQHWVIKIDMASGDVLWRLGPDGDFTLVDGGSDEPPAWFYGPHAPAVLPGDELLIFDNGNDRPEVVPDAWYSRAVSYRLDEDAMTATQVWSHRTDHYTEALGDVDPLPGGHVLISAGGPWEPGIPAQLLEVTGDDPATRVWELLAPHNVIYRAERLPSFYP